MRESRVPTGTLRVLGGSAGCQQSPEGGVHRVLREGSAELESSVWIPEVQRRASGIMGGSQRPKEFGEVLVEDSKETRGAHGVSGGDFRVLTG